MSQGPPKTATGTRVTWKSAAVLVAAGLGSFVLAVAMQNQRQDPDTDLAVSPRVRLDSTPKLAADIASPAISAGDQHLEVATNTPQRRMNQMVVRDPFGPLAPEVAPAPVVTPPPAPPPVSAKARKPPVAVEPAPPPPPTAPPLPFTAVGSIQGKKIGNGQQQAFIQHGDALTIIQKGDTVAGNYRVDDITADRVTFTYLPLGQKQSLLLLDNPR
ncbi:hypothetical protein [Polaromonas sp.]|uniref:hypothetical protein n=1 Tax=Polaromonas sp. TaxID=1869339 RepID=UPI003263DC1A